MTTEVRKRAYAVLMRDVLGTKQLPEHLPYVYVVGKRIFFTHYAAKEWVQQVCPKEKIELVSILQAYGVRSKEDLPKFVRVNFGFGSN